MNTQTIQNKTFSECLLTPSIITAISSQTLNDRGKLVVIELITNIAKRSLEALATGELFKLDPNPGDLGCQIRAIAICKIVQDQEFLAEATSLTPIIKRLGEIVLGLRRTEFKAQQPAFRNEVDQLLFVDQKGTIPCSKAMEFVLLSGFLNALRNPFRTLENGIIMSQTETSKLNQFSKNVSRDLPKPLRDDFVNLAQSRLTFLSMEQIREIAGQVQLMDPQNKALMTRMLSVENTMITQPKGSFPAKALGCQFFLTETTIQTLREQQGLAAIKTIVPKGEENTISFFRSPTPGADLQPVPMDEIAPLNPQTPIVVFHGVVGVPIDALIQTIQQVGFTRMILTDASIQNQFGSDAKAEDLKDPEARSRILSFKKDAEDLLGKGVLQLLDCKEKPTLMLYHLFANTLGSELNRMNITLQEAS